MTYFAKSRARFFFLACLIVAGYFAYSAVAGAIRTHQLEEQRIQAEQLLASLQARKAYVTGVRDYVSSDQYVEQEARRRFGYIRPGEVPFVVISPPLAPEDQPTGEWWERLFPR